MTSRSLARDRNISLRRELLLILRNSSRSSSSAMTILSAYIGTKLIKIHVLSINTHVLSLGLIRGVTDTEVSWTVLKARERLRLVLSWVHSDDWSHAHTP